MASCSCCWSSPRRSLPRSTREMVVLGIPVCAASSSWVSPAAIRIARIVVADGAGGGGRMMVRNTSLAT